MRNAVETITPAALADLLENDGSITLIDVREPYEWDIARIAGARLIPLGSLNEAVPTIDPTADIVVYCHHGVRSEVAVRALLAAGVRRARNLVGGIERWSLDVDGRVRRY